MRSSIASWAHRPPRSKRSDDKITLWIIVKGNFGKEATQYAVWQNPHLKLLQVENAPPFPHLSFRLITLLSGKSTDWPPRN